MRQELANFGYLKVERLIHPDLAAWLYRIFQLRHWRGEFARDDQVPLAASFYDDATLDAVLLEAWQRMEELSACQLVPTYAYGRLYLHGNVLTPHRDRPACEISASIHLGHNGDASPLCFEPDSRIHLACGDGVLYLGQSSTHWRERFDGISSGQIFLHYVQKFGVSSAYRLDQRPHRFPPSSISRGLTQPHH